VMGLASRAAPQMHLQDVGAPLKILAGGAVLFFTLGVVAERLLAGAAGSDIAMKHLVELGR
jgi:type III secretion protein T